MNLLSVSKAGLEFTENWAPDKEPTAVFQNIDEFNAFDFSNIDGVMCSSSVDFPEEDTNDKNVIALCHALRSMQ